MPSQKCSLKQLILFKQFKHLVIKSFSGEPNKILPCIFTWPLFHIYVFGGTTILYSACKIIKITKKFRLILKVFQPKIELLYQNHSISRSSWQAPHWWLTVRRHRPILVAMATAGCRAAHFWNSSYRFSIRLDGGHFTDPSKTSGTNF